MYRQEQQQFINFLSDIALGVISEHTQSIIEELTSKTLNAHAFGLEFIPHIFCTNFEANFYNMNKLINLPGDIYVYDAIDTTSEYVLNKVTLAESQLKLKIGAEVMLLNNLSDKLKNGTRGKVIKLENDGPTIDFKDVGIVTKLHRCTWFAYKSGEKDTIVGQRSQFPLRLAWGITAHKAQGRTLSAAVVHSGNEFLPGQLYVACSRVSTKEGLQIVNFCPKKIIKEDFRVAEFYSSLCNSPPLPDLSCCKGICMEGLFQGCIETDNEFIDDGNFSQNDLDEIEKSCSEFFLEAEEQEHVNLEDGGDLHDIFNTSSSEDMAQEKQLPNDLDIFDFLETLKDKTKLSSEEGSLKSNINSLLSKLQTEEYLPRVHLFLQVYWAHISDIITARLKTIQGNDKFDFKGILANEMLMLSGMDITFEFSKVVQDAELSTHHYCTMTEIVKKLRSLYLCKLYANCAIQHVEKEATGIQVWKMDKNCHGKVRYVGGWVIAKLIQANRKYINTNISSTNMLVRSEMHRRFEIIKLLESLLMHSSTVHNKSEYLGSLEFTDLKQFRDNALVYISDDTFMFFMELEQLRVTLLCQSKLYLFKSDLLTMAVSTVKQNQNLLGHWTSLFEEQCCKNFLKDLFCQAVDKYFRMGCGQFLRDFKRDHNVKKTEAHRKRVVERKAAKQQKDDKITIKCLSEDQSSNKQDSHRLLVAMVTKQPGVFNSSVYNKNEIKHIYKAYGIKYVARWNKSQLNDYLVNHIKCSNQMGNPEYLNDIGIQ